MKKIEIIPLARKKLKRRSISEDWVTDAMIAPDQMVDGYGGRRVAHKKHKIGDKEYLLRVIFERKEEADIVLTPYMTSQGARYWKEEQDEN